MVHFSSSTGGDSSKKLIQQMRFENVQLFDIEEKLTISQRNSNGGESYSVIVEGSQILIQSGTETTRVALTGLDCCAFSSTSVCIRPADGKSSAILQFSTRSEADRFVATLKAPRAPSAFDERTEETSATQYFQFYGYLSQQQNMMQDYIRTATYQRAILSNLTDFRDKVVLDVGAGSGILSFFAAQAGAKKVYAVEASSMAEHCQTLVKANNCANKITVISGKIEEISLPEQVDTIISEPMGYMLLNERMLETFLHAKKFLKPKGKIFPTRGDLHVAPFCDEALFMEQCQKANFWSQEIFYGVNLTTLKQPAIIEYFKQPVVDTFDVRICVAQTLIHKFNFDEISEDTLHDVKIPLRFQLQQTGFIHGLAFWFDCAFIGSDQTVWLSTAPTEALTHWYQVRCLIATPLFGRQGEILTGQVHMVANKRQSYDVEIRLECDGKLSANTLDLKNPYFRYTGQAVAAPPGSNTQSPAEQYWLNAVPQVGAEQMITNGVCMGAVGETAMNMLAAGNNMGSVGVSANRPGNAFITTSQATASAVPYGSDFGLFASGGH